MKARFAKAEALFHEALELPPEGREAFVQKNCGADAGLRQEVVALLRASGVADHWLKDTDCAVAGSSVGKSLPDSHSEGPGAVIDRYKLLEKIGEGGFGVVYMAEQEQPVRRKVALKIIKLGMDTRSVIARFESERQALALMDHPNIAKVLDAGATATGRPYFVMELVHGVPITKFCEERQLNTAERLALFIQVCGAIQHAHQKGIIHRDIKPTNVLVTLNDGVPYPMVIDFGVAKALHERLTEKTLFTNFAQMIGTPAYMSPEQAEMSKLDVDTRSDVYSFGVLLYELLTGTTPFPEERLRTAGYAEIQRIITEEEPERPSTRLKLRVMTGAVVQVVTHYASLATDLDWVVMKCLEKDRARRYGTANGLAADLRRFLNSEPIVARPPSNLYRLRKLIRRNKLAFAAGGLILVTVLVGFGATLWALVRERDAHLGEQRERFRAQAAVTHLEIERAEQFFAAGNSSAALAYLARILRVQPTNRVVAERILWALSQRNFSLPTVAFRHSGQVTAACFSPAGDRVATASQDGTARVWDSITGAAVTGPLNHQQPVLAVRFSVDGRNVLTGSQDGTARVWDADSGVALTPLLRHDAAVTAVDFSPDGKLVATASYDMTARLWDAVTGQPVTVPLQHSNKVFSVCFSPDGQWLLTAAHRSSHLWNVQTGQRHSSAREGNTVNFAKFNRGGDRILTGSANGSATIWEVPSGRKVGGVGSRGNIHTAEFSPEESRIGVGGSASFARVLDPATGQPTTGEMRHPGPVMCLRFSPQGRYLLTGSNDNTVRIWDSETGETLAEPLYHDGCIRYVEFSPDGQRVLTVSDANLAFVWNIQGGQPLALQLRHKSGIAFARFSPTGRSASTVGWDEIIRSWDVQTGTLITNTAPQRPDYPTSPAYSPDGRKIVIASYSDARVLDAETLQEVCPRLSHDPKEENIVYHAAFNPHGTRVVTACTDGTARIWDAATGAPLLTLQHSSYVKTAFFSPDGRKVLTASYADLGDTYRETLPFNGKAFLWDADTGQLLLELPHDDGVKAAQFSPDGERIITASLDKTARMWDARTGQPLGAPLQHINRVVSASFSPNGAKVLTRCVNAAYVWNARQEAGAQPLALTHQSRVESANFSPDNLRVITASFDDTARIWDAETGHPLSDPIRHRLQVNDAQFSPDGRWIMTASGSQVSDDDAALIMEVPRAELPSPAWLAELAEALAGQRLDASNASHAVSPEQLLNIRDKLLQSPEQDGYASWGKWFFADPLSRTISPSSRITVPEYLRRQLERNTLLSLEKVLSVSPTNGAALGRLVRMRLKNDSPDQPWKLALADRQTRLALQAAPDDPELWAARAEVCERTGAPEHELHEVYARFAEVSRGLDNSNPTSTPLLFKRAQVLRKLDRLPEAADANLVARRLPPRNPNTPATLLDLSLFYNYTWALNETVPPLFQQRPQRLGDVEFDVRGAIRLNCTNAAYSHLSFPARVNGLRVLQKCRELHFLHAVAAPEIEGAHVATYAIWYNDGQVAEVAIKYGDDVRTIGRVDQKPGLQNPRAAIVWRGTTVVDGDYRLFSLTWSNSRPDVGIRTIDFISKMTASSPLLVAITVEP